MHDDVNRKEKISYAFRAIFVLSIAMWMSVNSNVNNVHGKVDGKGTKESPYVVNDCSELEYALTEGVREKGKTYVGISGKVSINKKIDLDKGDIVIYALTDDATLMKIKDKNASINATDNPKYCMHIGKKNQINVSFGTVGKYKLTLGGNRSFYEQNKITSSGWMMIYSNAKVTFGEQLIIKNMINNDKNSGLTNINVYGKLTVKSEIKNCSGINGGAISIKNTGTVIVEERAVINKCESQTEGGAIWIKDKSSFIMNGGIISGCSANQEGGAIFVSGIESSVKIERGTIKDNYSKNTGGGIFSGYGAKLILGNISGETPEIVNNKADGSGGGVRANGGVGEKAGGEFICYKADILQNISGKYGGGISVGNPGEKSYGYAEIYNARIEGNNASNDGGGIDISSGNLSKKGVVVMEDCIIKQNHTDKKGGGVSVATELSMADCTVSDNTAADSGGGINIDEAGQVTLLTGKVTENKCNNYGAGIYLRGKLKTGDAACISEENETYIYQDKYIEIVQPFQRSNMISIDSKVKTEGTKLIYVSYNNGTGEDVLYRNNIGEETEYDEDKIKKYVTHIDLTDGKLLRSTGYVKSMNNNWIIISKKYLITYISDIRGKVEKMPKNQIKFFNESTTVAKEMPVHDQYIVDEKLSWNTSGTGGGVIYKPGSAYEENKDIILYVIWRMKKIINIEANDRYYVVGQNLTLNSSELLKKVRVNDNLSISTEYPLYILQIKNKANDEVIFQDNDGKSQTKIHEMLSTKEKGEYELLLKSVCDEENVYATQKMKVFIIEDVYKKNRVRFVSEQFIYTISSKSKWKKKSLYEELMESLSGNIISEYYFEKDEVTNVKRFVSDDLSTNEVMHFLDKYRLK